MILRNCCYKYCILRNADGFSLQPKMMKDLSMFKIADCFH